MRKFLPLFLTLLFASRLSKAQCDAAFTYSVNQNQISFSAAVSGGAIRHSWQFGDGITDIFSAAPVHSYNFPGQYTVLHTVRDSVNNCIDSSFQLINLNFGPTCSVNFTYIKPSPLSGRHIFFPQVTILGSSLQNIEWTINGASISAQEAFEYTFNEAADYEVCVKIQAVSGCTAQKCFTIKYRPYIKCETGLSFTHMAEPTQTRQINFAASPDQPQLKFSWNYGDGQTGSGQNVSHLYSNPGIYNMALVVTDSLNFCVDSLSKTIQVESMPSENCTASFTHQVNGQGQAAFVAISNQIIMAQTWTIFSADSLHSILLSEANPVHSFADTGSYFVCLAVTTTTGCNISYCELLHINSVSGGRPALIPSYPNPVSGEPFVRLKIDLITTELIKYKVCNLAGMVIYQSQKQGQQGTNIVSIPVQQLMRGQYFIEIITNDKQQRSVFQKL